MLFIPMKIKEEEQQLCRQEKELKSDKVIFQIPKEREEKKNQHIRNDERHVMLINYDKLKREKEKVRRRWKKKKDIGGSWERVRNRNSLFNKHKNKQ